MSSTQDEILVIAEQLGEFTTGQMSLAFKGTNDTETKTKVYSWLCSMVKYGHIKKVGKSRTEANQKEIVWRYIA